MPQGALPGVLQVGLAQGLLGAYSSRRHQHQDGRNPPNPWATTKSGRSGHEYGQLRPAGEVWREPRVREKGSDLNDPGQEVESQGGGILRHKGPVQPGIPRKE